MHKFNILLTVMMTSLIFSCTREKKWSYKLSIIEQNMLSNPHKTLNELDSISTELEQSDEEDNMYYQILLCRTKDLCYKKHGNDSIMRSVAIYYEKHGNNERLMQAYYCLGCIYRDMNKTDISLDYFLKARDLSKNSKKYELVERIYSQIGQLHKNAQAYAFALESFKKAYEYAVKARDEASIPFILIDMGRIHNILEDYRNGEICLIKAKDIIMKKNDHQMVYKIYLATISLYIANKDYKKAAAEYKQAASILSAEELDVPEFNFYLALINSEQGDYNAAIRNYDKATHSKVIVNQFLAHRDIAMFSLNKSFDYKTGLTHAITAINLLDSMRTLYQDTTLSRMQHMYNYEKAEKENAQLRFNKQKDMLYVFICISIIILLTTAFILSRRHLRKIKMKFISLKASTIEHNKRNEIILKANNERIYILNLQKLSLEKQISQISKENEKLTKLINSVPENPWEVLFSSEAYKKLCKLTTDKTMGTSSTKKKEAVELLTDTVNEIFNGYESRLKTVFPKITTQQIQICCLTMCNIKSIDIADILCTSKQNISNIKRNLRKQCTTDLISENKIEDFLKTLATDKSM